MTGSISPATPRSPGPDPATPAGTTRALVLQDRIMPAVGDNVGIRLSVSGGDDVLLGAAMHVLEREFGVV